MPDWSVEKWGLSARETEAMAVSLRETTDEAMAGQSPVFIKYLANDLGAAGIPVVTLTYFRRRSSRDPP
jgi:tryptophanase